MDGTKFVMIYKNLANYEITVETKIDDKIDKKRICEFHIEHVPFTPVNKIIIDERQYLDEDYIDNKEAAQMMSTSNFREILDTILKDHNLSGTVVGYNYTAVINNVNYSNILNDIYDICSNRIKNKVNTK